jgi:hypothetical protein
MGNYNKAGDRPIYAKVAGSDALITGGTINYEYPPSACVTINLQLEICLSDKQYKKFLSGESLIIIRNPTR